ncbi:Uncharacterised protein [Bordetella pertussis]|nr:Uncharacterised protein [Bordetella pertussis]
MVFPPAGRPTTSRDWSGAGWRRSWASPSSWKASPEPVRRLRRTSWRKRRAMATRS